MQPRAPEIVSFVTALSIGWKCHALMGFFSSEYFASKALGFYWRKFHAPVSLFCGPCSGANASAPPGVAIESLGAITGLGPEFEIVKAPFCKLKYRLECVFSGIGLITCFTGTPCHGASKTRLQIASPTHSAFELPNSMTYQLRRLLFAVGFYVHKKRAVIAKALPPLSIELHSTMPHIPKMRSRHTDPCAPRRMAEK